MGNSRFLRFFTVAGQRYTNKMVATNHRLPKFPTLMLYEGLTNTTYSLAPCVSFDLLQVYTS